MCVRERELERERGGGRKHKIKGEKVRDRDKGCARLCLHSKVAIGSDYLLEHVYRSTRSTQPSHQWYNVNENTFNPRWM